MRHIGLIALLFCALSHAWFGHDLLHGHHHHELQEASYSTAWKGQTDQLSSLLDSPALVPRLILWRKLQVQGPWVATLENTETNVESAKFLDAKQVPRPPPRFSFIA